MIATDDQRYASEVWSEMHRIEREHPGAAQAARDAAAALAKLYDALISEARKENHS